MLCDVHIRRVTRGKAYPIRENANDSFHQISFRSEPDQNNVCFLFLFLIYRITVLKQQNQLILICHEGSNKNILVALPRNIMWGNGLIGLIGPFTPNVLGAFPLYKRRRTIANNYRRQRIAGKGSHFCPESNERTFSHDD